MTNIKGFEVWDDDFDRKHFTPEEIAASNFRVSLVTALINSRHKSENTVNRIKIEKSEMILK